MTGTGKHNKHLITLISNLQRVERYHTRKEHLGAPVAKISMQEYHAAKSLSLDINISDKWTFNKWEYIQIFSWLVLQHTLKVILMRLSVQTCSKHYSEGYDRRIMSLLATWESKQQNVFIIGPFELKQ